MIVVEHFRPLCAVLPPLPQLFFSSPCSSKSPPRGLFRPLREPLGIRKSHNWIVGREVPYVMTVRAAVENLMLFSLYKIFVGRSCSTHTNLSHEPPLISFKIRERGDEIEQAFFFIEISNKSRQKGNCKALLFRLSKKIRGKQEGEAKNFLLNLSQKVGKKENAARNFFLLKLRNKIEEQSELRKKNFFLAT